jgi:hypothetical protein
VSFTDTRAELVTALSTVPGVTGHLSRPKVLAAGAAWPLLEIAERGPGLAWGGTWRVILCLGGNELVAFTKLDEWLPLVVDALTPVAYATQAIPFALPLEGNRDMFAADIRCLAE